MVSARELQSRTDWSCCNSFLNISTWGEFRTVIILATAGGTCTHRRKFSISFFRGFLAAAPRPNVALKCTHEISFAITSFGHGLQNSGINRVPEYYSQLKIACDPLMVSPHQNSVRCSPCNNDKYHSSDALTSFLLMLKQCYPSLAQPLLTRSSKDVLPWQ